MDGYRIPLGTWMEWVVDFLLDNFEGVFDTISDGIGFLANTIEAGLTGVPPWVLGLVLVVLALWRVSWKFALFTAVALTLVLTLDLWEQTAETLALVLSATLVSLMVGIPLGIWMARNDTVQAIVRPVLDFMQTMPAFVYLIPAAMFFGLGTVPGTIATFVFAMPPAVRLTNLGIRQVPREMVEAGLAFGCTRWQLLRKVQLPNALPSIMAGVNQTIMLALSMVVIASMIGAGGLGDEVLRGIQRMNLGLGFEGGLGVVILAIILDRITQSFGAARHGGARRGLWAVLFSGGAKKA